MKIWKPWRDLVFFSVLLLQVMNYILSFSERERFLRATIHHKRLKNAQTFSRTYKTAGISYGCDIFHMWTLNGSIMLAASQSIRAIICISFNFIWSFYRGVLLVNFDSLIHFIHFYKYDCKWIPFYFSCHVCDLGFAWKVRVLNVV